MVAAFALGLAGVAHASGLATDVTGLYYTGVNSGYGLLTGGATDTHWTVTYASITGGGSQNSTYQGSAYVVNNSNVVGSGWTQNSATSQWIVAPGAADPNNGNSVNTGGDFLPGNGNTGTKEGIYIYTLAFNIEAIKLGVQGVTIVVAAGDDGVANYAARFNEEKCGYHPIWPGGSPYVLSVGATTGTGLTGLTEL